MQCSPDTYILNCVLICDVFTGAQCDLLIVNVKDTNGRLARLFVIGGL